MNKVAIQFEEYCLSGKILDTNTRFCDFAEKWLHDYAEKQLKIRTLTRYKELLERINIAFGNMKISAIQPYHLTEFYNNLAEKGVRADIKYAPKPELARLIKNTDLSQKALAKQIGVALSVVRNCSRGNNVTGKSAERVSEYFSMKTLDLFEAGEDRGLSDKTILHYHALLSSIFTTAVQWQVIFSNPCDRVKPPKVKHKEGRYLDEVQAADLIAALDGEPYQFAVMVQVLLYTGLRRGELFGLEWPDIDFYNNRLTVKRNSLYIPEKGIFDDEPKTEKSKRSISLSADVVELLKEYRKWQVENAEKLGTAWNKTNRLFTAYDGKAMHPDTLTNWFHDFVRRKKLPDVCVHSLRHTNTTLMIASGVPLKVASTRLGHASITTTGNTYAHAIKSADEAAADTLNEIFSKKTHKNVKIG